MPPGTAPGTATIIVTSGDGIISAGSAQVALVAPSLFSANSTGKDAAAGFALRVRADGSRENSPITRFDSAQNKFVPAPIDLGPSTDQVFLVLFGTGFRFRSSLAAVSATIGGANSEVLFAGDQEVSWDWIRPTSASRARSPGVAMLTSRSRLTGRARTF